MKILLFGDIVSENGFRILDKHIDGLISKYDLDFIIANGENISYGKGIKKSDYEKLIDAGVDCVTLGNHYSKKNEISQFIDGSSLIRPINIKKDFAGVGSLAFEVNGTIIRVTNILGNVFMHEDVYEPIPYFEKFLSEISNNEIHIVDFHAETTGEKIMFAHYFDGRVSAVIGTHTHVQTKDSRILSGGTGFLSDVGMCGPYNGILGVEKTSVINKLVNGSNKNFSFELEDDSVLSAVVLDIDVISKKCNGIFTIYLIDRKN